MKTLKDIILVGLLCGAASMGTWLWREHRMNQKMEDAIVEQVKASEARIMSGINKVEHKLSTRIGAVGEARPE